MTRSRLFHAVVIMGCSLGGTACGGSSDSSKDPQTSQAEGDAALSTMGADAGSDETEPTSPDTTTDAAAAIVDGSASDDGGAAHDAHVTDEADAGWPPTK